MSNARHPHDATPPPEGGDGVRVVARGVGAGQRARVARLFALLIAIACVAAPRVAISGVWLWTLTSPGKARRLRPSIRRLGFQAARKSTAGPIATMSVPATAMAPSA